MTSHNEVLIRGIDLAENIVAGSTAEQSVKPVHELGNAEWQFYSSRASQKATDGASVPNGVAFRQNKTGKIKENGFSMKCAKPVLIVTLALVSLMNAQTRSEQGRTAEVDVCTVLRDPSVYDGQMVKLSGKLLTSPEDFALGGENCPGIFRTKGYTWPSVVYLQMPTSRTRLHPVDFTFDSASQQQVDKEYQRLKRRVPERCISWTYVGMLETHLDWSKAEVHYPNGSSRLIGFGHGSAAPAQLLIKRVESVFARPDCK